MSEDKQITPSGFNPDRRQFLIREIPGAVLVGYTFKTGIVVATLESLLAVFGRKTFGRCFALPPRQR